MSKYYQSLLILFPLILISFLSGQYWLLVVFLIVEHILIARGVISLASGFFGPATTSIDNSESIFLTFDDGPHPEITPKVLELLDRYSSKATFFLIAKRAEEHPDIVKEIIKRGHTIGSHDLTHPWWANFRLYPQMSREITQSIEIIKKTTGKSVKYYRPPVGLSNPHVHTVCKKLDITIVGWNKATRDGGNRNVDAIKRIADLPIKKGDIVLLHDVAPTIENSELFLTSLETLLSRISMESITADTLPNS